MCGPLLVRSVSDDETRPVAARRRGVHGGDRGRARLHDQRPGHRAEAKAGGERRRAVEGLLLRHREPEHELVDLEAAALVQRPRGHLRGDVEAGDVGGGTLPADERRRPGGPQWDVCVLELHSCCDRTAIVTRLTATRRSSSSVWSTSHTHVVRPRWRARARAVIHSPRARLQEARVVGGAHRREPVGVHVRDRRLGGEHLRQRGVGAAVHEPEALAHAVGDREARRPPRRRRSRRPRSRGRRRGSPSSATTSPPVGGIPTGR